MATTHRSTLMSKPPAIPEGSKVLVTGVTGYLGSHVADQLLLAGYRVRGTARDETKAKWSQDLFDERYEPGKFEAVVVPDMTVEGAYDEAVIGVSGIAHVAANIYGSIDTIAENVNGTLQALRAAAKQPTVRRVVVTSSSAAVANVKHNELVELTPDMYNDEAVKLVRDGAPMTDFERPVMVYSASKVESERACWKFMEEEKPDFVLNTVLPNAAFGPVLKLGQSASTGAWVGAILDGRSDVLVAAFAPQHYIDVRDAARLHVAALTQPDVISERIFGYAEPWNWTDLFRILRQAYPDHKIPDDIPNEPRDMRTIEPKTYQRGVELLKRFGQDGFIGLEESVKANAEVYRK